jgi:hypothetical protein
MTTHLPIGTIERYAADMLPYADASSVEAHLLACSVCRQMVGGHVDQRRLDRVWVELTDRVDESRVRLPERWLHRVGIPAPLAKILVYTPSLRGSWLMGVVITLALAVLAARTTGGGDLPFLAVAPVLPVVGIAVSFGRAVDAAWEVGEATPTGGFPLLLIRTGAVLAACVPVTAVAALVLPAHGAGALAWLLPSFLLVVVTLTISTTRAAMPWVAGGISAIWLCAVAVAAAASPRTDALFGTGGQAIVATLTIAAAGVLLTRRNAIEQGALR